MRIRAVRKNDMSVCSLVDYRFLKNWLVLLVVTFFIILPTFCVHLRFSIYNKIFKKNNTEGQRILTRENNKRLEFVNEFLTKNPHKSQNFSPQKRIDVGISIITVSRSRHSFDDYEPRYLSQVLVYLMHYLKNSGNLNHNYQIFICNVDDEPTTFDEIANLSNIVPMFNRFSQDSFSDRKSINSRLEKEKEDYIFCGQQTLLQNVSYVFLLEDDALPHHDIFTVLDHLLTKEKDKMNSTYVKFYHPERLLGYISLELERIPELLGLSVVMAALLVSLYQKFYPLKNVSHLVLWTTSIIYFVLLFLAIGRQNLIELRRISRYLYQLTPAPSCCTPANLYPRHGMEQVIKYLKEVTCYSKFGKDTAIDQFRVKSRLSAIMVQPNLFRHIGMYSSLRENLVNPFIV